MPIIEPTKPHPARRQTDESLRSERSESDRVISDNRSEAETNADDVLERARDDADAILEEARDKADARPSAVINVVAVAEARKTADEVLEDERAAADAALQREREEQRRALALLLPLERDKTDRFLLTERVRADNALANRDDFLGIVSHDLRNLLSGVVLESEMLARESAPDEAGKKTVARGERIQRYVARMNRLIGDLVDVVSIDAGKLAIKRERSDPAALVAETMDAFALAATNRGVSLTSTCATGLEVAVDADRLMQVLANLIGNALKLTPSGGHVVVECSRPLPDGPVLLTVKDTGPGIAPHMFETVFERFWQGNTDLPGLGLGLYISRCIIEGHGGRIWVESAEGEGAAFYVELPVAL